MKNGHAAIESYKAFLKLGYTHSIPKVYETAGVRFDFSANYIQELMQFVHDELQVVYQS
jgi:oligoendopeptidase F